MMFSTRERADEIATTLNDGEFDCLDNIDFSPAFEGIMAGDHSWEYHVEQHGDGKYEIVCYEPSFPREYGGRHMELIRVGVI
jgi:hypothetical protein